MIDGFEELLLRAIPRLAATARALAPPGVSADDVVQDTLERAWRSRDQFSGVSALGTWLHRILVNRIVDHARSLARGPMPEAELPEPFVEISDPEALVVRARDAGILRAALSRLGIEDRLVLVLRDAEQWTAPEIAELIGVSVQAVYKRSHRARMRLAQALADSEPPVPWGSPPQECREIQIDASGYAEGRLPPQRAKVVEEHLSTCRHCPLLAQALVGIRSALAGPITREGQSGSVTSENSN